MSNAGNPQNALDQVASFMLSRARDVGVTEGQILQLLGFKGAIGPVEALFSGRPVSETLPEMAASIMEGTDEVLKMTKPSAEQAIPVVVLDEAKPTVPKMMMLNAEGLAHLDVYVNFLISQGFIKK